MPDAGSGEGRGVQEPVWFASEQSSPRTSLPSPEPRAEGGAMRVAADRVRSTQERCKSRLVQVDNDVQLTRRLGFVDDVDVDFLVADIFAGLTEAGYTVVFADAGSVSSDDSDQRLVTNGPSESAGQTP